MARWPRRAGPPGPPSQARSGSLQVYTQARACPRRHQPPCCSLPSDGQVRSGQGQCLGCPWVTAPALGLVLGLRDLLAEIRFIKFRLNTNLKIPLALVRSRHCIMMRHLRLPVEIGEKWA
jgi:hypothetical protein